MISGDLLGGRGKLEEEGGATSQMYLFIWMRNGEEGQERGGGGIFSCFVICHSTKNVHGNYKQTSQ